MSEALIVRSMLLDAKLAKKASVILVHMGLPRMAKIEGTRNPADLMTKYVATDVLQRLKTQVGVVSNWFKDPTTYAHDTDDHVACSCSCDDFSMASSTPTTALLGMAHAPPRDCVGGQQRSQRMSLSEFMTCHTAVLSSVKVTACHDCMCNVCAVRKSQN